MGSVGQRDDLIWVDFQLLSRRLLLWMNRGVADFINGA